MNEPLDLHRNRSEADSCCLPTAARIFDDAVTACARFRYEPAPHLRRLAVQAFALTDVKAYMGHADIQTTMIYVHHVPQNDAADKLSRLLESSMNEDVGCTPGARAPSEDHPEEAKSADFQGEGDAGGGTRTPDTRIMMLPLRLLRLSAVSYFPR
jgi:hypothetical protein